jgi:uncharacterized protein
MVKWSDINTLAKQIADQYRPDRIILFGSYAWGQPREDSDVDLLVLMPTAQTPYRAALEILNSTNPRFAVDLVVRTPEDAQQRYKFGDPLIREAFDRGQVLYEHAA